MIKQQIRNIAHALGYEISRVRSPHQNVAPPNFPTPATKPYTERPEYGPSNLLTKLENVKQGLPFEFPDILNLNLAVARMVGDAKRICELGCGTGNFAVAASEDSSRFIVASEYDEPTYQWVKENKSLPNIRFVLGPVSPTEGPFDLVVAIELVEHVGNFPMFLSVCASLAERALITTPNRARGPEYFHAGPPPYYKHVREWTAGEFYWVLRCFYRDVTLYALTSQDNPEYVKVDVDDHRSPLVADCRNPLVKLCQ